MRRLPLRSPPRMRGKAKNRCRSCPLTRITPACAGKRAASLAEITSLWDHPRVCGEKRCGENLLNIAPGSPPRMRGKGPDDRAHPLVPGITPACAGKRKPHLHKKGCTWDHPRVCGEKVSELRSQNEAAGITPAYAGKSSEDTRRSGTNGDHPRVCGEKSFENGVKGYFEGSPPRMRGKGSFATLALRVRGITPAYAGKSNYHLPDHLPGGDHPRVCGEKTNTGALPLYPGGSPPRMRGKET